MCVCVMKDAVLFSVAQTNTITGSIPRKMHELIKIKYVLSKSMQCNLPSIKASGTYVSSVEHRVFSLSRVCLGGLW